MSAPSDDARAIPAPPARTFSIWPAATVLLVAVGTIGVFALLNAFDTNGPPTPTTLPDVVIVGAPDPASPAAARVLFAGFRSPGIPPGDVASALTAPAGTTRTRAVHTGGGGVGNYDQAVELYAPTRRATLLGFYQAHLEAMGWTVFSRGPARGGGDQLLFERPGSDGWYWKLGVVASGSGASTPFTYRLEQVTDVT